MAWTLPLSTAAQPVFLAANLSCILYVLIWPKASGVWCGEPDFCTRRLTNIYVIIILAYLTNVIEVYCMYVQYKMLHTYTYTHGAVVWRFQYGQFGRCKGASLVHKHYSIQNSNQYYMYCIHICTCAWLVYNSFSNFTYIQPFSDMSSNTIETCFNIEQTDHHQNERCFGIYFTFYKNTTKNRLTKVQLVPLGGTPVFVWRRRIVSRALRTLRYHGPACHRAKLGISSQHEFHYIWSRYRFQ